MYGLLLWVSRPFDNTTDSSASTCVPVARPSRTAGRARAPAPPAAAPSPAPSHGPLAPSPQVPPAPRLSKFQYQCQDLDSWEKQNYRILQTCMSPWPTERKCSSCPSCKLVLGISQPLGQSACNLILWSIELQICIRTKHTFPPRMSSAIWPVHVEAYSQITSLPANKAYMQGH